MIFIHTLRMLADLSVYFFIAQVFVISVGGASQFAQFVLLGLCYGLMVYLQHRGSNKICMLLPMVVLFVPGSYVPAIIPPVIYMVYLIYSDNTRLSWDRQSELFSLCTKFFPLTSILIYFLRKQDILVQHCLPVVFISLVTSVFLMRMLRQPRSVYLEPNYQRKNAALFCILIFIAWLCSRDFMFRLFGGALSLVYTKAIYPVLNGFIMLFMGFLRIVMALMSWFKLGEIKFTENHLEGGDMGPTFTDVITGETHVATTETVLTALLVIFLLICAFYFFRWLALHNGEEIFISDSIDIIRGNNRTRRKKERATTTVLQIRKQYRTFLKLYRQQGGKIEKRSTSLDILNQSAEKMPEASADLLAEMRQIYINARYAGTATKADLKRMKQINKELMAKE